MRAAASPTHPGDSHITFVSKLALDSMAFVMYANSTPLFSAYLSASSVFHRRPFSFSVRSARRCCASASPSFTSATLSLSSSCTFPAPEVKLPSSATRTVSAPRTPLHVTA